MDPFPLPLSTCTLLGQEQRALRLCPTNTTPSRCPAAAQEEVGAARSPERRLLVPAPAVHRRAVAGKACALSGESTSDWFREEWDSRRSY